MNYEGIIKVGYVGMVLFSIFTIFLCFKLNIKQCILEVSGVGRKLQMKKRKVHKPIKLKKEKRQVSKRNDEIGKIVEKEKTMLLMEEEETDILREESEDIKREELQHEQFVYVKDVVVVHTEERI